MCRSLENGAQGNMGIGAERESSLHWNIIILSIDYFLVSFSTQGYAIL